MTINLVDCTLNKDGKFPATSMFKIVEISGKKITVVDDLSEFEITDLGNVDRLKTRIEQLERAVAERDAVIEVHLALADQAHAELQAEKALADRLAVLLYSHSQGILGSDGDDEAIADYRKARGIA